MQLSWPVAIPLWQVAARLGLPISVTVEAYRDDESKTFFALNRHIGLAVEADSLEGLLVEIELAVPELLSSGTSAAPATRPYIHFNHGLLPA